MTLALEAISAEEGVGIVRAGQALRLVRPPYTRHSSPVLPEDALQDAIVKYGYAACRKDFPSWDELVDFLNREAANSRRNIGRPIPPELCAFAGAQLRAEA